MYILWIECSHNQLTNKESGTIQTLTDQKILSVQLQIIKMLDGPKFHCKYCKKQIQCMLSQHCELDLHILDMITLWLTTGQPGDDTAIAFDKNATITLVLAKKLLPHPRGQRHVSEQGGNFLMDGLIGEKFLFKARPLSEGDRNIIVEIKHGSMIQLDSEVAPLLSQKFVTLAEKSSRLLHTTVLLPRHFPGREQQFEVDKLRRQIHYRWVDNSFSNSGEGVHDISEAYARQSIQDLHRITFLTSSYLQIRKGYLRQAGWRDSATTATHTVHGDHLTLGGTGDGPKVKYDEVKDANHDFAMRQWHESERTETLKVLDAEIIVQVLWS
ncbi:uncharacterized protein LAESUDRAFT_717484 [Laetiporus sulphureus 93-53]|uniref:Uncharacterized protein n=1 Tax=Laetiporus sulphureus 93-53 TaxID=1314785 RepID=A0A165BQN8_9APHY|nr:uncharacterized protein LAESUDRAFT_717484 [Laetiporus sulphureus 93-53]KZT01478.1 hypothetical protein LAESUDRAFT_717484 [Laetiporus sulphureus 93-53]